jgi:hypothetical protein
MVVLPVERGERTPARPRFAGGDGAAQGIRDVAARGKLIDETRQLRPLRRCVDEIEDGRGASLSLADTPLFLHEFFTSG